MPRYADIVLPLDRPAYTFAVPEGMTVEEGQAVAVPFGPRKIHTGIVWRLHDEQPAVARLKSVLRVLSDGPLVGAAQRKLWEWIASYYLSTPGAVMRVALPSLMKPSAYAPEAFDAGGFRLPTETWFALVDELRDPERLHELFEHLERRAPRQYEALLEVASASDPGIGVPRRLLAAERAMLRTLEGKGWITACEREPSFERQAPAFRLPALTDEQQAACEALQGAFDAGRTAALLHGVTASGKTEVYIHLIARTLAAGGDVLMLVPEIALTTQLIERMERIFGSRVAAYHSKLTNRRRTETYLRLNRSDGGEFVVGARSALFLPLAKLRLVVVDEEHDTSFKQADPAPRYHARDAAVMLARLSGARAVLGSATPSLETWLNARSGKYGLARLDRRYGDALPPRIVVSDTLRAVKRGERRTHFNKLLLDWMDETLARGEQVMLFQNRRGFAPYVSCPACGWTARCPDCNVALAWHRAGERLVCHYCGHAEPLPPRCPACGAGEVRPMGFGTEKVEEEIARLFPSARTARLDRDTVGSERAFRAIVDDFARRRTDILVGTQMITKGFDFEGVGLVGILNADNLLNSPDFRAAERAFQLMTQVAGRAGRRNGEGRVVIQTADPAHPVIRQVVAGDFEAMARTQLAERAAFFYPPYARLMALTLRHRDPGLVRRGAAALAERLRTRFGRRLLGPMAPPVDRIRGEYLVGLLLKIESGASASRAREIVAGELAAFAADPLFRGITLVRDVDPQ